jgi:hypothetical protein
VFRVEGHDGTRWCELHAGTTIGDRRLIECSPATLRALRVTIDDAVETPRPLEMRCYAGR